MNPTNNNHNKSVIADKSSRSHSPVIKPESSRIASITPDKKYNSNNIFKRNNDPSTCRDNHVKIERYTTNNKDKKVKWIIII